MVQGGGVEGRDESGSGGTLLTDSSDISRRIRSNLLEGCRETNGERVREGGHSVSILLTAHYHLDQATGAMWESNSGSQMVECQDAHFFFLIMKSRPKFIPQK